MNNLETTEIQMPSLETLTTKEKKFFDNLTHKKGEGLLDDLKGKNIQEKNIQDFGEWDNIDIPKNLSTMFKPNITFEALQQIALDSEIDLKKSDEFMRIISLLMIYSGVFPGNEKSKKWLRFAAEFSIKNTLPIFVAKINDRRMATRGVPKSWQSDDKLRTPFILYSKDNGVDIIFDDGEKRTLIAHIKEKLPLETSRTIAYTRTDGQYRNITINPRQKCTMNCDFCFRRYGDERTTEVAHNNYSPEEIAKGLA